jgi:hypothetical protein
LRGEGAEQEQGEEKAIHRMAIAFIILPASEARGEDEVLPTPVFNH